MMEYIEERPLNTSLEMNHHPDAQAAQLIAYTQQILNQLLGFVEQHLPSAQNPDGKSYAGPGGSHIRHIVEHYEALMQRADLVDYDARARDILLETNAQEAMRRIEALKIQMKNVRNQLNEVVQVRTQIGLDGQARFTSPSTIGRELIFLASHSIHHCAILKPYCEKQGITVDAYFGIAPSTVAYQLQAAHNWETTQKPLRNN